MTTQVIEGPNKDGFFVIKQKRNNFFEIIYKGEFINGARQGYGFQVFTGSPFVSPQSSNSEEKFVFIGLFDKDKIADGPCVIYTLINNEFKDKINGKIEGGKFVNNDSVSV